MQNAQPDPGGATVRTTITFGQLVIDLAGFMVPVGGTDVALSFTEHLVLKELVLNPGRVIVRATLFLALNIREFDYKHGHSPVSMRTVDTHVSRLRRKLAAAGYACIKTMRFVGYGFMPLELPSKT
jgi:DNA-binding response OmpR family regulator